MKRRKICQMMNVIARKEEKAPEEQATRHVTMPKVSKVREVKE